MKELTLSTKIMIGIFIIVLLGVIGIGVLAGTSSNDNYEVQQTQNPF